MATGKPRKIKPKKQSRLARLTGIGDISQRFTDLSTPWKSAYRENMDRLERNLNDADDLKVMPFDATLAKWGINSEQDMTAYVKNKKYTLIVGAFLFLFAGVGFFFQPSGGVLAFLSGFSCLSVATLGAILCSTSIWRLDVLRTEKFVPFRDWLINFVTLKFLRESPEDSPAKKKGNDV